MFIITISTMDHHQPLTTEMTTMNASKDIKTSSHYLPMNGN